MTQASSEFAARIRQRFPEGLTGIIAIGGTRTTYILSHEPGEVPGRIDDPIDYARFTRDGYISLIKMYFELGGQNLIVPTLSYQSFYERGQEYVEQFARLVLWLINDDFQQFYRDEGIDPYFPGLEPLLMVSAGSTARRIAEEFEAFQAAWQYQPGRRTLIWEIAPIPPLTFWQAGHSMSADDGDAFNSELLAITDMEQLYQRLFRFYARNAFGTEIPEPHFYLATNRNGDLKLRAQLSLALLPGRNVRLFYTPYPTLFITRETLQTIIENVATGGGLRSIQKDYEGKFTNEILAAERARVFALRDDPQSTLGLMRQVMQPDDD